MGNIDVPVKNEKRKNFLYRKLCGYMTYQHLKGLFQSIWQTDISTVHIPTKISVSGRNIKSWRVLNLYLIASLKEDRHEALRNTLHREDTWTTVGVTKNETCGYMFCLKSASRIHLRRSLTVPHTVVMSATINSHFKIKSHRISCDLARKTWAYLGFRITSARQLYSTIPSKPRVSWPGHRRDADKKL